MMKRKLHIPIPILLIGPFRRLSLVSQFMILGALILLIGAIVISWWINRAIEQQVMSNSMRVTSVFVDSSIAPQLWDVNTENVDDATVAQLDSTLQTNMRTGQFVAFHIISPLGTHIYSSFPMSHTVNMLTIGTQYALAGQVHSEQTDKIAFAPDSMQKYPNLVETYFPVRDRNGQKIIAVASFYQSLDTLRQNILETQLQGWVVVGTSTFLMYVMLFGLIKRGSDTITRQQIDLAESRQQIQSAAVRAAEVNEAAMRRLGADLHDGPAQDLGIALMRMEPLRESLSMESTDGKVQVDAEDITFDLNLIHTALQSSLTEIRNMASGLRLPDLNDLDLAGTIRKAVADYIRKTGRPVNVDGPNVAPGHDALKSASYRIVQEALNNGHLHGKPSRQDVSYSTDDKNLKIIIRDDGSGFDTEKLIERIGRRQLGLAGLQERAEILGGHLLVHSAPGKGTTIEAVLPLYTMTSVLEIDVG
ncbi:MAG TPA: ATP-binding protein [Anaerolineae bacterium]